MTLHNLYRYTINKLTNAIEANEAHALAYIIIEHFTSQNKLSICLNPHIEIEKTIIGKIDDAIQELQNHKPIQYMVGKTSFCDLPFFILQR